MTTAHMPTAPHLATPTAMARSVIALSVAALCATAGTAHAQLSPRYQDANQDLVADTPTAVSYTHLRAHET